MQNSSPDRPARAIPFSNTTRLNLSFATSEYEHFTDLINGTVQPEGIVLTPLILPIEDIAFRHIKNVEFDIAETSFAKYVGLTARGDADIVGIPVFPARLFRHSAIYVRRDAGMATPRDLEGRTVGIPEWAQTAGVYLRGLLSEYYGVALDKIRWVQAGVNEAGRVEKLELQLPPGIHCESRPDRTLSDMLESGEIDAALTARSPTAFRHGGNVVRMFPDFRAEEERYHADTGIFPIMHVITIRRRILEDHPWVAMNLFRAFERAKDAAVQRLLEITTSRVPLPWGAAFAQQMAERMGGDLWPYGVPGNSTTLDAFLRFAHDQRVTSRLLSIEDLFPKEVLQAARV